MIEHRSSWNFSQVIDVPWQLMAHDIDPTEMWVYDLGCGMCESGMGQSILKMPCAQIHFEDVFEPYIKILATKRIACPSRSFSWVPIQEYVTKIKADADAYENADNYAGPKRKRVAIITDVLEHIKKVEGLTVLGHLFDAVDHIALWIPLGDSLGYISEPDNIRNEAQRHVSVWEAEDLDLLGFDVVVYDQFHQHVNDNQTHQPLSAAWAFWHKAPKPKYSENK